MIHHSKDPSLATSSQKALIPAWPVAVVVQRAPGEAGRALQASLTKPCAPCGAVSAQGVEHAPECLHHALRLPYSGLIPSVSQDSTKPYWQV